MFYLSRPFTSRNRIWLSILAALGIYVWGVFYWFFAEMSWFSWVINNFS